MIWGYPPFQETSIYCSSNISFCIICVICVRLPTCFPAPYFSISIDQTTSLRVQPLSLMTCRTIKSIRTPFLRPEPTTARKFNGLCRPRNVSTAKRRQRRQRPRQRARTLSHAGGGLWFTPGNGMGFKNELIVVINQL